MIRFIFERSFKDMASGYEGKGLHTVDINVPELEKLLTRGGMGENGHDITELIGAEIIGIENHAHRRIK
jgi:hypothetical protein